MKRFKKVKRIWGLQVSYFLIIHHIEVKTKIYKYFMKSLESVFLQCVEISQLRGIPGNGLLLVH